MEELLGAILEVFGEVLFQLLMELLAAFLTRGVRGGLGHLRHRSVEQVKLDRPSLVIVSTFSGVLAGVVSLAAHPAPFFHPTKIHGVSLVLSPLLTGLAMSGIGTMLRRRNQKPVPWESFWGGFAFALGMAVIRFVSTR